MQFEIAEFWEDESSYVYREFLALPPDAQARVLKRIEIMERHTIERLQQTGELEKVTAGRTVLYELKLRITPPVRILGVLEQRRYRPLHLFQKKRQKIAKKDIRIALQRR